MMVPQQGQTYLRELDPPPLPGTLQRIGTGPNQTEPGFTKGFHEGFSLRVQGGFVPSVLFAFLHGQPVGFSGFLEHCPEGSEGEPFREARFHRFLQRGGSGIRRTG